MKNVVTLCLVFTLVCGETGSMAMIRSDSQETLVSEGNRSVELIEIVDNSSRSREASLFDNNISSIRICVERGDDVNMDNLRCGTTPLTNAAQNGNEEIVNYLLNNGANPNKKSIDGFLPIEFAIMQKNPNITRLLVEKGADLSLESRYGTPLSFAKRCRESAGSEEERAKVNQVIEILENRSSSSDGYIHHIGFN